MESVSGALMAGYSLESAWKYAQRETGQMYGTQSVFCRELQKMNQKLSMHEPMEQLIYELAEQCDNDDIYHFAEIMRNDLKLYSGYTSSKLPSCFFI